MALQFELLPVTPFMQNCTLLWDEQSRAAVLTDVGGEAERLLGEVAARGLDLQAVWLTHGHVDHVGGVVDLTKQVDVPVLGPHADDDFWIQQLPAITQAYHFPFSPPFTPTRWLNEGDTLTLGEHVFEVLHIPGHTPGHVVFFHRQARFAQVGDVLFQGSIGRTDFPRGDHQQLIDSITGKLWPLGNETTFVPGHGPVSTFGRERQSNPYVGDKALR